MAALGDKVSGGVPPTFTPHVSLLYSHCASAEREATAAAAREAVLALGHVDIDAVEVWDTPLDGPVAAWACVGRYPLA